MSLPCPNPHASVATEPANLPFAFAAATDPGKSRFHNEDSILTNPELGIALLADGLGGHRAGEVASRRAVELLHAILVPLLQSPPEISTLVDMLHEGTKLVNRYIYKEAHSRPHLLGMGTTLLAAVFQATRLTVAHVGDSRLYRWRDSSLTQLSEDHCLGDGSTQLPANSLTPQRHILTRALGVTDDVSVDILELDIQPNDCYLLCSDGLSDMLPDEEIAYLLRRHQAKLSTTVKELIDLANRRGGHDNVSVILVRATSPSHPTN